MAEFEIGRIVISRQGKDAGLEYVVSGIETDGRVKLIRPDKFNVKNPKKKNPKHLQKTLRVAGDLAEKIKAGKDIDAGNFHRSVRNGE
ncbi:MAG: KOW domain-containing protein [Synergistaceae bacterium]|nr:KOW domain-containing protein [Synergistaceae bacterium]MBQ7267034.1 KOW domain-containing protein [Synergistaceae bacterium]